jgi:hypothetical protein
VQWRREKGKRSSRAEGSACELDTGCGHCADDPKAAMMIYICKVSSVLNATRAAVVWLRKYRLLSGAHKPSKAEIEGRVLMR